MEENPEHPTQANCAVILNELSHIKADIADLKKEVSSLKKLVTGLQISVAELLPIKRLVYGMIAMILSSILGTALMFVLRSKV
jgi:hypothetical protein